MDDLEHTYSFIFTQSSDVACQSYLLSQDTNDIWRQGTMDGWNDLMVIVCHKVCVIAIVSTRV